MRISEWPNLVFNEALKLFHERIPLRDYVAEGMGEEIFRVMSMTLEEAAAYILPRLDGVNTRIQNDALVRFIIQAKMLCKWSLSSAEDRAKQALMDSLVQELANGEVYIQRPSSMIHMKVKLC